MTALMLILGTLIPSISTQRRTVSPLEERQLSLRLSTSYTARIKSSVGGFWFAVSALLENIPLILTCGPSTATASASCVGIVGATLAAGVNNLQGIRGLLIDSLVSLRVVTATGKIITVSANENPNLFWALRGAGSNFGVVTSATYKIYDITNGGQVVNADYLYPASANRSVWKALEAYDSTLPAQLALTAFVLANGTAREVNCPKPDPFSHR